MNEQPLKIRKAPIEIVDPSGKNYRKRMAAFCSVDNAGAVIGSALFNDYSCS
jgi:hypothetical protein